MLKPSHALVGLALLSLPAGDAFAAVFATPNPATQNRFLPGTTTPNPGFLLSGFSNLSGVAVDLSSDVNNPRGATLIAPNYYLAEAHFATQNPEFMGSDGVIRSYTTAETFVLTTTFVDNNGVTQTRPSDVFIGRLDSSPTADGVATLPIIDGDSFDSFTGLRVFAVGQDNVAGTNIIQQDLTGLAFNPDPGSTLAPTFVAGFDFDTPANGGRGGTGGDEIGLTPGDSSNPQLADIGGELALIGGHFGIDASQDADGNFDFTANYGSFSSLAAAYLDQINAIVGQGGQSVRVVAVPEPASLAFAAGRPAAAAPPPQAGGLNGSYHAQARA